MQCDLASGLREITFSSAREEAACYVQCDDQRIQAVLVLCFCELGSLASSRATMAVWFMALAQQRAVAPV